MKAASLILALMLPLLAVAQTPTAPSTPAPELRRLLQDGLFEEEANRNLEKASAAYEALLEKFEQNRQYAATAVFRLAEIRVKQNRKEDAVALFQRVVAEFGNDPLARLSRERIAALGGTAPATGVGGTSDKEAEEIARLQDVVKNSPDLLNAPSGGGKSESTPLGRAAREGWLKAATFLLDHGADLGARFGKPALNIAAEAGRKAMVELLLSRGADPNLKDAAKRTPLLEAVTHGRVEVVRLLLDKGARPNEQTDLHLTPLHEAALRGDVGLVQTLVDKGADLNVVATDDPNVTKERTGTPLMIAVRQQHLEVAKLLLERGADLNIEVQIANIPITALSVAAVEQRDRAMLTLLLEHGAIPKAPELIHRAVHNGDVEVVRLLVKHGADVNVEGNPAWFSPGWRPLHTAVGISTPMVRTLLELGAKPDAATKEGLTPLHIVLLDFPSMVDGFAPQPAASSPRRQPRLPQLGHQVSRNSSPGGPPRDPLEICKLLVEKGANVNAQTASGASVLHRAAAAPGVPLEFVSFLLARGADPKASDPQGNTPAMVAPIDRRLWLEERTLYPEWIKQRAIHTVIRFGGSFASSAPHRRTPLTEFDLPPAADEVVRQAAQEMANVQWVIPLKWDLLILRADPQGKIAQVAKIPVKTDEKKLDLPELQWGDVVIASDDNVTGGNYQDTLQQWWVSPVKPVVRKLTVQLGDRQREFEVGGNQNRWTPGLDPLPEWNLSNLVSRAVAAEPRADLGAVKVQRAKAGPPKEWSVDLRPEQPGGEVKSLPARLANGDRVIIPLLPEAEPEPLAARRAGIYRVAPGRIFGEQVFRLSKDDGARRTLGDLIAESYLRSFMIIPDPDLAHIRIHRLKGSSEETLEVDLASAVEKVDAATTQEDARKLDVPLEPGDIVEIVPRKDANLDEWKGLTGPVRRFLTKALTRDVHVQTVSAGGNLFGLNPEFAEYQRASSEAGNSWSVRVAQPQSPFRAWSVVKPGGNLLNVRITSGERVREFSAEEFARVNPWLVHGDRLVVERL